MYRFLDFSDSSLPYAVLHMKPVSIAREVLYFESSPGHFLTVARDIDVKSFTIRRAGAIPDMWVMAEELLVPRITLQSDRLCDCEDVELIRLIANAVPCQHTVSIAGDKDFTQALATAANLVREHGVEVANIICCNSRETLLIRAMREAGINANVHSSPAAPPSSFYLLAAPECVGVFFDYGGFGCVRGQEVEDVGMAVVNDYATSKVTICDV